MQPADRVLVIACGALAREIVALARLNDWSRLHVRCLPPELHNRPERIPTAVRDAIVAARDHYASIFVAFADCGTNGALDDVLRAERVPRLPGAHCYDVFAGARRLAALAENEPGTFYLTDFLARHFDRLVIEGLGLDRHPELLPQYFGHYRRLVYLSQTRDEELRRAACAAAARLALPYEEHFTGYGALVPSLAAAAAGAAIPVASASRLDDSTWQR